MTDDYFESDEFKESHSLYLKMKREGVSCYLDSDEFINISDYYVELGNIDEAEDVLAKAVKIHPEVKTLRVAYAGVLICNYKFEQAKNLIKNVSETDSYDVLYLQAQLLCAVEKKYQQANVIFHKWIDYIDKDFDDDDLDYDTSLSCDEGCYDYSSKNRDARFRIIMSYIEFADKKNQDIYVRQWLKGYISRFNNIGKYKEDYFVSETCYDLGHYDILEEILTIILNENPYYEKGWTMLGISQHFLGDDAEALNSLQFALAINPDNILANLTYAQCMLANSNYEKALEYLLKSTKLASNSTQDYYIGKCYYKLGDTEKAIAYFNKVFEAYNNQIINDSNLNTCFDVAEFFFLCNNTEKSLVLLNRILEAYPNFINGKMLHACIFLHKHLFFDALDIFVDIILKSNYDKHIITEVASRLLAYNYYEISIFLLKMIVNQAQSENNNKVLALLAIAYFKAKRCKECLENLSVLCKNDPNMVKTYFYSMLPDSVLQSDYYEYLSMQIKNSINTN